MEGAAVQAVCDFRGLDVYMFFTSGDLLDAPEWTMRPEEIVASLSLEQKAAQMVMPAIYNVSPETMMTGTVL